MNVGQVLETHLGWAAATLGFRAQTPVFDGASDVEIEDALGRAWIAQQAGAETEHGPKRVTAEAYGSGECVELRIIGEWLSENGYEIGKVFSGDYPGEARRACLELWLSRSARAG